MIDLNTIVVDIVFDGFDAVTVRDIDLPEKYIDNIKFSLIESRQNVA